MRTTTSSFRVSNDLRDRLEKTARRLKRGKNSIVTQALEEARRQSILASTSPNPDEEAWLEHADTNGWK